MGSAPFYLLDPHTLSTFNADDVQHGRLVQTIETPLRTINSFGSDFDLVSIDVEGWNEQLAESIDFSVLTPKVFIAETIEYSENGTGRKLTGVIDRFKANGYSVYADTHINTILVRNP
jgi:hypothetical protein